MQRLRSTPRSFKHGLALIAAATFTSSAGAQTGIPVFSIDWESPTLALPDSFTATPITEGDVLAPNLLFPSLGPLATPGILESGGTLAPVGLGLALHGGCVGHAPGTPCGVEVDALSHGLDEITDCNPNPLTPPPRFVFSVSWRALGDANSPLPPNVWSEAQCLDEPADVFIELGIPCGPFPPSPPIGHTGYIDGNGLANCTGTGSYPGLGLIEGVTPLDDLDALDDDMPDRFVPSGTCTYFSLDAAFLDPTTGLFNSGSAAAHGFQPGDVLTSCNNCAPALYASALALGLDAGGPGTDDLDALVLHENGVAGYQRSSTPYDWMSGARDMLFFSVRRGSQIVGTPDFFFGVPIEPGDILVPTGPLGSPPGIWIAAETLGLTANRSTPGVIADDIDALDLLHDRPPGQPFCFGDGSGTPCPCLNFGVPGHGCANSSNSYGAVLWANGFPSITIDTVRFTVSGMGNNVPALLFQGTAPLAGTPFGDGLRCVAGTVRRLIIRSALCGNREYGYNIAGDPLISVQGAITGPGTYHYQVWYRDPHPTFCSAPSTFNLSNGYTITWFP